jgi:hypothetical protein
MKTLLAFVLALLSLSVHGQVISYQILTNYAQAKNNGIETNVTSWDSQAWGGTGLKWTAFNHALFQSVLTLTDSNVVKFRYLGNGGFSMGDGSSPTSIGGDLSVLGTARDASGNSYVTTIQASNNVRVAAGSGISVAASGSGNVMTYTVTDLSGLGATNAISAVNTNAGLVGGGLTALTLTNGADITASGTSNNSAAVIAFSLDPTVKINLTNYATSIGALATGAVMQASGTLAIAIGTLGTNATNNGQSILAQANAFTYTIGGNATSFVYQIGANLTNFGYLLGANGTNFGYLMGANGTSYVNSVSANKQDATKVLNDLTNSGIQFTSGNLASNVAQVLYQLQTTPIPTNSALSNVVVNFRTNKYLLTITNNITLTNFTGLNSGVGADTTLMILPQLINRGVGYPTFGTPSFGQLARTNANSPMWTTLTSGIAYAISVSAFGTNTFWAITEWR